MDKEFLLGLGVDESAAEAIIDEASREVGESVNAAVAEAVSCAEKRRIDDKFEGSLRRALERAGARNMNAARAALAYEWDGEDFDDAPRGLDEAVKKLRDDEPYLFFGGSHSFCDSVPRRRFIGITPVESIDDDEDENYGGAGRELTYSEYVRKKRGH